MGWNVSNILVNEAIANKKSGGGGSDPTLAGRVTALESTVGDASSGLVKDVNDLETETGSLDDRVTALEQGGGGGGDYTAYAFEDKTPTSTAYEDYATITLPAGTYHVIAGVYNGNTTYPTTGIKVLDGTILCSINEGTGLNHPCCMGIFSQTTSKEYKVQIRGNSAGGATSGYYLVKKLADYTPNNNTRKGVKK